MRFFKAFSLLHRRTKSETFIPGYIPPTRRSFAVPSRPSSLPTGLGSNKRDSSDISSIFDFATARFIPVSADFNHLRGINYGVTSHPFRNSQNSLSSLLVEENMRLREALDLWFSQYSKADELLQKSRTELALERDKVRTLQHQMARDQELILDLKRDVSRYEKRFESLRDPRSSYLHDCWTNSPLLLPGPSDSVTSLVTFKKTRTLDEYTSSLRMTLATRRQLRDQKKISKFWKNMALRDGKWEDTITPSTSAISSVHDFLPPDRKRAIDALMRERGWPYPQAPSTQLKTRVVNGSSEPPVRSPLSEDVSLSRIHPVSSTLDISVPISSVGSRLAPLASESLKAEINLLFGIQRTDKLMSSSSSKKCLPADVSGSATSKMMVEPSRLSNILKANNLNFSFGSYGDLSQRFSNLFSQDHAPRVKLPIIDKDDPMQKPEPTIQSSQPSSSHLAESSAPSGSSQMFSEALALLQGQHDTDLYFDSDANETGPLKSARSWETYIAPAATSKTRTRRGKENAMLISKPLSVLKTSKIRNPLFVKDETL